MRMLAHVPNTTDELVSTSKVAAILGCSVATVNRMAADGRLAPALQGEGRTGARFFRLADVEALAHNEGQAAS